MIWKKRKVCQGCQAAPQCRDSAVSWFFLLVGVIATISVRVVNLVLHFGDFWPKLFWYLGVAGFFLYFLYKFRQDRNLRRNLLKYRIQARVASGAPLEEEEKKFLNNLFCQMQSSKDGINYFFIFSSSAVVLLLAVIQDFIRK